MSDPPPSPGPGRHAGHKHAKRPEGSRHSSDWISRLHRRHDAKHHTSRAREEEEVAPLLAQPDEHHQEDHQQGHGESGRHPGAQDEYRLLRPVQSIIGALKNVLQLGAFLTAIVIQNTVRLTKSAGTASKRCASNAAQKVTDNPKRVMAGIILLLASSNITLGSIFGVHLARDNDNNMCSTPACIRAADNILRNLHLNADAKSSALDDGTTQADAIDPCTDFDKFVCGSFDEHHDLRSDQGHVDAGTLITARSETLLRDALERPASKIPGSDKPIFKKLKAHYTACMAEEKVLEKGLKPLKDIADEIKRLMGKHHPVQPGPPSSLQISTTAQQVSEAALSDTLAHLIKMGVKALFDIYVATDDMAPSEQAIFVSPVQAVGLAVPKMYEDEKLVAEYRAVTKEILKHFFDVHINATHVFHTSPGQKPRLTSVLELAQAVVDFEIKLAMITPPKGEEMDVSKSYNKMNASAFESLLPQFSLSRFVTALAPSHYTAGSVVVSAPDHLHKLSFLLQLTPKEVLRGFLVWKAVQQHADRIEDSALKPLKEFNTKMRGSRVDQPLERWRQCVKSAKDDLPWIAAWFFLQNAEADLKKDVASKIAREVAESFVKSLEKIEWMTKIDSEKSAKKIEAINQQIGAPKGLDAAAIESHYSKLSINDDTYFENRIAAANFEAHQSWSKLGRAARSKDWDVTSMSTRPDYDPTLNRLIIPAALLRMPISYDDSVPDYVLYGSFGAVSGHGITKALGPLGSFYNKNGTLSDMWTEKTRNTFEKKAQCFIDHYSGYTVEGPESTAHHVNGNLTLSENMADIGGVYVAFQAWKEHEKAHPSRRVPGLEKYSKEQIFWIAYGNTLCSITTKEKAVQHVHSSRRAPERVRILGTVANSREFLEAFKCPAKKPKCDLW